MCMYERPGGFYVDDDEDSEIYTVLCACRLRLSVMQLRKVSACLQHKKFERLVHVKLLSNCIGTLPPDSSRGLSRCRPPFLIPFYFLLILLSVAWRSHSKSLCY